jgi:glutaredoxin
MGKHIKRLLLALLVGLLFMLGIEFAQAQSTLLEQVIIYIFWGEGCPHCRAEREFLTNLKANYPQLIVREYEVFHNEDNRQYLQQMLAEYGLEPSGVPTTFINDRYWVGFSDSVASQIETAIMTCLETTCVDAGLGILPVDSQMEVISTPVETVPAPDENTITLPLIGEVGLDGLSLWLSTALISFVDGFNPCSLWVLSLLLALVLHSGSRTKIMIVGLTFLTVTSTVYILFIIGLFSIFSFVSFIGWIQVAVALLALAFALINIKDYFWYKQGVSLTIADKHKPKIYRDMRSLLTDDKSTLGLIGATAFMASGITLVELPCTSGLPVLWTNLIAAHQITTLTFVLLLGLYMLIFLADELIVFCSVVFTLKASRFEEKHGRLLKLIGGLVMLVLAIVLLINPSIMNSLSNSLLIFSVALLIAFVVIMLHRYILPRYGIYIGNESFPDKPPKSNSPV